MSVFRENTQRTEQKEITEQKETFAKEAKIPYRCKHPALNSTNNSTTVDSKTDIDVGLVYADHTVDSFVSAEYPFEEITESRKNYNKMFKIEYVQKYGMDNFLENVAHNDLMKYFQTIPNLGGGNSFYYAIVNFIDSTKSLRNTLWKTKEYLKLLAENLKLLEKKQTSRKLQHLRDTYPHHHGTIIKTLEFFKMHWIRHLVYNEVKRDRRTTEKLKEMLLKGVRHTLSNCFRDSRKQWSLGKVGQECQTIDGMEILAAARIIKHDIIIRFSRFVSNPPKNRVGFRYFEIKPDNMQLRSACILKVNNGQYANLVAITEGNGPTKKESFDRQQKNKSTPEIFITQNSALIEDLLMHEHNRTDHIHGSNLDKEYWSKESLASRGYTSRGEHRTDYNRSNGDGDQLSAVDTVQKRRGHEHHHRSPSRSHHSPHRVAPVAPVPTVHMSHSPCTETFKIGDIIKYAPSDDLRMHIADDVGMVIDIEEGTGMVTAALNRGHTIYVPSTTISKASYTTISKFKQWLDLDRNKRESSKSANLRDFFYKWRREQYEQHERQRERLRDNIGRLRDYAKVTKENRWWKVGDLKINRVTRDLLQKYKVKVQSAMSKSHSFFVYFKGEQAEITVFHNQNWQIDLQNFVERKLVEWHEMHQQNTDPEHRQAIPVSAVRKRSSRSRTDKSSTHHSHDTVDDADTVHQDSWGSPSRSRTRRHSKKHKNTARNMPTVGTVGTVETVTHRSPRSPTRRKPSKKRRSMEDYKFLSDVRQHYERYRSKWIQKLPSDLENKLFKYVQSQEEELRAFGFYHQNFTTPNWEDGATLRRLFPEWPLESYLILQVLNSIRNPIYRPTHNSESEVDIEYLKKEIMLSIGTKGACCFLKGLNRNLKRQLTNYMKNIITLNMGFHNGWLFDLANIKSITTDLDLDVGIGLVLLNWGYSQVDVQSIQNQRKQHLKEKQTFKRK